METKDERKEAMQGAEVPDATVEDVAGGLTDASRDPAAKRDYTVSLQGAQFLKQGK